MTEVVASETAVKMSEERCSIDAGASVDDADGVAVVWMSPADDDDGCSTDVGEMVAEADGKANVGVMGSAPDIEDDADGKRIVDESSAHAQTATSASRSSLIVEAWVAARDCRRGIMVGTF